MKVKKNRQLLSSRCCTSTEALDGSEINFLLSLKRGYALMVFLAVLLAVSGAQAAGKADSGWIPIWKGSFDGFKIYFRGQGYIDDPDNQDVYIAEPDQIHVKNGTNGLIVTDKPLSYYHVRVNYKWGAKNGSENAGLMTHVDINSKAVKDNRPHSIELNMRRDQPGSVWLASNLGPFGSSYINDGKKEYLPKDLGGKYHDFTPFGDRTWQAYYENGKKPTNPYGEWNTYEALVYGADSVVVIINNKVVNRVYDIRLPDKDKKRGESNAEGGVALQSEGHEIFYKDWEMRSLIGCTDPKAINYGSWYVMDSVPSACQFPIKLGQNLGIGGESMATLPAQAKWNVLSRTLMVSLAGSHSLHVMDFHGKTLWKESGQDEKKYRLGNTGTNGILFLVLRHGNRTYRMKAVFP